MKHEEVTKLLEVASIYQNNIANQDPVTMRDAWFYALDMRMTVEEGIQIAISLASENAWISPGSINEKFLAKYRKPHEQGAGRAKLPGQDRQDTRAVPLEVGSKVPVRAQDVPEYMEARKGTPGSETPGKPPSWTVACPHCGALPGNPCTVQDSGRRRPLRLRAAHPSREEAVQVDAEQVGTTVL